MPQAAIQVSAVAHDMAIVVQDAGVRPATNELILSYWIRRAGTPEFKAISRLIR